jgi:hypothetical protein
VVDFSVPDTPELSAEDIFQDLKHQLTQPNSRLRRGLHTKKALDLTVHPPPGPKAAAGAHGEPHPPHPIRSHPPYSDPQGKDHHGYKFDLAVCQKMFEDFDWDRTGRLKINALTRLSEKLWETFHPHGPALTSEDKEVSTPTHPTLLTSIRTI